MQQPVDFQSLFAQLQTRFPCSSLMTELVQVHEGSFVVRALVQVGGMTLATGMASASTVESAEDQAQLRVLSILGISSSPTDSVLPSVRSLNTNGHSITKPHASSENVWSTPTSSIPSVPGESPGIVSNSSLENLVPPPLTPLTESVSPVPSLYQHEYPAIAPEPEPNFLSAETAYLEEELLPDDEPQLPESSKLATVGDRNSIPDVPKLDLPELSKPSKPSKVSNKGVEPSVDEPDDLSSLIALTDVEMDRVGWTKQEGRQYLKQTYSKSTRQKLEVDELLDFLNHLRALPSTNGL